MIALLGLYSKPKRKIKFFLASLIVMGGLFASYQTYLEKKSNTENENKIKNLLLSASPSHDQIDQFNPILGSFLNSKFGPSNFSFSNDPNSTIYDIKNMNEERIGYLLLTNAEFMDIISSEYPEQKLDLFFEKPSASQTIDNQWNNIAKEIINIVSQYATTIGGDGSEYFLDTDQNEMWFRPKGLENYPKLIFNSKLLEELTNMSRSKRGVYLIQKCEEDWKV